MKRRSFLKQGIATGGALYSIRESATAAVSPAATAKPGNASQVLQELRNGHLHAVLYADASALIRDLNTGQEWRMGPVAIQDKSEVETGEVWLRTSRSQTDQYPGRFAGEVDGDALRFTLIARQNRIMGRFRCRVALEDEWLVYRISDIDDGIPSLVFPPPVHSQAIVIPMGVGRIIRNTESSQIYTRHIYPFFTRLNMRWVGGQQDGNAWIGVFDEGFEDACALVANRTAAPVWTRTLGAWRHGYSFRFRFMRGDYNELARCYRQWFDRRYGIVTLRDKIQRNPDLESFLGGRAFWITLAYPTVSKQTAEDMVFSPEQAAQRGEGRLQLRYTYAQLREQIDRLKDLGLRRGFIKIAGWINGGYDYSHQDIWPPEPALGSIEELRGLLDTHAPLITGLHDNNQDIYPHTPSFPDGVIRLRDGELLTGGVWAGGQTYILGSNASLRYARRNWEHIRTLGPRAMFVDIITAMNLYQSYEEGRRLTKAEDLQYKIDLMRFYLDQGILLGSEEAADFGIPYLDWYENRHQRTAGESIPLWPLVFHDAAFCTRYGGVGRNTTYPGWLEDMLWGYLPHFSIQPGWSQEELFRSIAHVDEWHTRVGLDEMTAHRFLDADFQVEQTEFSGGASVICNFGDTPAEVPGGLLAPGGYRIL